MDPIGAALAERGSVVVDGGLSTQLELGGADLGGSLWTATALLQDPGAILDAHLAFLDAGADVLITASYQVSFEGFAERGLDAGATTQALHASVSLAREAADARPDRPTIVAASVGPYGATLADGSEYRGDYATTHAELVAFHRRRILTLLDAEPDLLAIETIPSIVEARALVEVLVGLPDACAWFAFTCVDGATLADGTPVVEAVALVVESSGVVAVGVNCTAPEFVGDLIRAARGVTETPIVAYPNRGGRWDPVAKRWHGTEGVAPADLAAGWRSAGATLIGGCCGTDAADIRELAAAIREPRLSRIRTTGRSS